MDTNCSNTLCHYKIRNANNKYRDMIGMKINRLKINDYHAEFKGNRNIWYFDCECECGKHISSQTRYVLNGATKSCGCYKVDRAKKSYTHRTKNAIKTDISEKFVKYVGTTLNYLKIIEVFRKIENNRNLIYFKCECICGKEVINPASRIINGEAISCGCRQNKIHELSRSRIYHLYYTMLSRCYNEKIAAYKHYGGRGIKVCEEWYNENKTGFINFYQWAINNGYDDELSIDRINVDGNYEPSNCRWVNNDIQAINKRNNVYISVEIPNEGVLTRYTFTIKTWSKITGHATATLRKRIFSSNRSYSIYDALILRNMRCSADDKENLITLNINQYIHLNCPNNYDKSIHD